MKSYAHLYVFFLTTLLYVCCNEKMLQKYFIAIVPPEPVLQRITEIKESIYKNYGTKGALRSPAHITLHMPFSWEENKEEKLVSALQLIKQPNSFLIGLNGFNCFEPRVVFIAVTPNSELDSLQAQVVKQCKQQLHLFNQSEDLRGFHPHLTVAFRDLKKATFYRLWEEYQHKSFDTTFNCSSFYLMKQVGERWEMYKEFLF